MIEVRRTYTFDNGDDHMSAHFSSEVRERLADEIGVLPEDLTVEVIRGYLEELRELGRGSDAARVLSYFDSDDEQHEVIETNADDEALYAQLASTLGLPADDSQRSFEDDEQSELFERFRPHLGLDE